jgi:uncharacterized membrane protein
VPDLYDTLKFLHVVGVIVLLGNVTITAYWKVMADRTGDVVHAVHAQRATIIADWIFTLPAIILIIVGGYGMTYIAGMDVLKTPWLVVSQILFLIPGVIWLGIIVPLQARQMKAARRMQETGIIEPDYRRQSRVWLIWGIAATVPLVAAIYVMITKVGY